MTDTEFQAALAQARQELESLPLAESLGQMTRVSRQLHAVGYSPLVLFPPDNFADFTRQDVEAEIDRVVNLPAKTLVERGYADPAEHREIKLRDIRMLVSQYGFVVRMRTDDADTWDEFTELYLED